MMQIFYDNSIQGRRIGSDIEAFQKNERSRFLRKFHYPPQGEQ